MKTNTALYFLLQVFLALPPIIMLIWTVKHLGGLNNEKINNWHPILMITGMLFCFFNGELW